jgi:hypothetical protein
MSPKLLGCSIYKETLSVKFSWTLKKLGVAFDTVMSPFIIGEEEEEMWALEMVCAVTSEFHKGSSWIFKFSIYI